MGRQGQSLLPCDLPSGEGTVAFFPLRGRRLGRADSGVS